MVRIRILSDMHYELLPPGWVDSLPPVEADVLILAGDYHYARHAIPHARQQFPDIPLVMVAGNHEHYRSRRNMADNLEQMREHAAADRADHGRFTYLLENETVVLETDRSGRKLPRPVRIVGCTFWTDFMLYGDRNLAASFALDEMSDYYVIRYGNRRLLPADTVEMHARSRAYIAAVLRQPFNGVDVVVTHHLPSARSIAPNYLGDSLSPAFASNSDDLLDLGADLWVHGHAHHSVDYLTRRTRVIGNPRGYGAMAGHGLRAENPDFDPALVVEL